MSRFKHDLIRRVLSTGILCGLLVIVAHASGQEPASNSDNLEKSFQAAVMAKLDTLEKAVDTGDLTKIRQRLRELSKALLRHQIALEKVKRGVQTAGPLAMDASLPLAPYRATSATKAAGTLHYQSVAKAALTARIELRGLAPKRSYMLCLNGKPPHLSDGLLPSRIPGGKEHYYDFRTVTTDAKGEVRQPFSLKLKPGEYDVKIFVKAVQDNYRIVLHNDYLQFKVEK